MDIQMSMHRMQELDQQVRCVVSGSCLVTVIKRSERKEHSRDSKFANTKCVQRLSVWRCVFSKSRERNCTQGD